MVESIAQEMAQYVSSFRYEGLPGNVVLKAKQCILDQLGVEIACATLPWSKIVYEYAKDQKATGKSTIITYGLKTNEEYAALTNGFFGQGFEIDDVQLKGGADHVGCSTVPVALAIGEVLGIGGKEFLASVVLGYQVMSSVGFGISSQGMESRRGFHPNSALGPFAGAAIAGGLWALDVGKLVNAFSIAGSHSSGLMEYAQTGGDLKRLYGGMGAMAGIRAAQLAKRGLTAPPTVFEGKKGFCQNFSNNPDPAAIMPALKKDYWILYTRFKAHCCGGVIHASIEALRQILQENPISPPEVAEISVGVQQAPFGHVGNIGPRPKAAVEAQLSMHFSLALTLVKGNNDFRTYLETDYNDPQLIQVAERVKMYLDEESERESPEGKWCSKVILKTKEGRSYERKAYARGGPDNPLTQGEVEDKFRGLATMVFKKDRTEEIIGLVNNLEKLPDISRLARLLVR